MWTTQNRMKQTLGTLGQGTTGPKLGSIKIQGTSYDDPGKVLEANVQAANAQLNKSLAALNTEQARRLEAQTAVMNNGIPVGNTGESLVGGHNGKGINPKLANIADPILKKYGLKVTSGYRPNSKLKTSQHVHGNAYDVGWSHLNTQQRRAAIQDFQKAGITGFGVGNNILHVDIGPKRHWTYDNSGNWISGMKKGYTDLFVGH